MVKFSGLKSLYPNFKSGLITAKTTTDFNYLLLSDAKVELSRFETGGYHDNPTGYMAFIYGDRDIYRPGDTVNVNTILRNQQWQKIADLPVKLKLLLPNGKEFTTVRNTLNKEGAFITKFTLPAEAVTGTYNIELYTGNDVLIATRNIQIEEFIPDRINLKLDINKEKLNLSDSLFIRATALNLFGPPAANRNYELQFNLSRSLFQPKGFEQFQFGLSNADGVDFPSILRQGKTDAKGMMNERIEFPSAYSETGMLQGKIFATVFDESGRPVNRSQSVKVQTQTVFLGVRSSEYYAGVGQAIQFNIVALNGDGKSLASNAEMQIVKVNYNNIMEKSYGDRYRYVSQKQEKLLSDRQITIGNKGIIIPFTANESGEYAIRLYNPGSNHYVSQTFYAYGWGFTNSGAFSVNTEGTIDITSDKVKYNAGDKAKLLFKTPFNGKLLVTVERNNLLEYHYP